MSFGIRFQINVINWLWKHYKRFILVQSWLLFLWIFTRNTSFHISQDSVPALSYSNVSFTNVQNWFPATKKLKVAANLLKFDRVSDFGEGRLTVVTHCDNSHQWISHPTGPVFRTLTSSLLLAWPNNQVPGDLWSHDDHVMLPQWVLKIHAFSHNHISVFKKKTWVSSTTHAKYCFHYSDVNCKWLSNTFYTVLIAANRPTALKKNRSLPLDRT